MCVCVATCKRPQSGKCVCVANTCKRPQPGQLVSLCRSHSVLSDTLLWLFCWRCLYMISSPQTKPKLQENPMDTKTNFTYLIPHPRYKSMILSGRNYTFLYRDILPSEHSDPTQPSLEVLNIAGLVIAVVTVIIAIFALIQNCSCFRSRVRNTRTPITTDARPPVNYAFRARYPTYG